MKIPSELELPDCAERPVKNIPSKIKGGYYIKARSITSSEIMHSPPHVREVWDWLLMKANHKDYKISSKTIKRGQLLTSLDEIREGLSWYVGYRKKSYTKDHMKASTKALRKASMITSTKTTRGIFITICNYDHYQDPRNYEGPYEALHDRPNETPTIAPMSLHDKQESKNKELKIKNHDQGDLLNFDIGKFLDDKTLEAVRKAVPGKDVYYYTPIYNSWIKTKTYPQNPVGSFINWFKSYTKKESY